MPQKESPSSKPMSKRFEAADVRFVTLFINFIPQQKQNSYDNPRHDQEIVHGFTAKKN
jgi:hypothetical protein